MIYPAINPGSIPIPDKATPATKASTGLVPILIATNEAAATPAKLPEEIPTSPQERQY